MNDRVKHELLLAAEAPTMSSVELVDVINEDREPGSAELRHDNFMAKIEKHPGIQSPKFLGDYKDSRGRTYPCYYLPKRECELMVMSESLVVQTKVYDRLAALESGALPAPAPRHVGVDPALSAARRARAIKENTKTAELLCARFPGLGLPAQQTIFAKLVNQGAGEEVMPLPTIEKMISATEVGKLYGITKNAVGKIANAHGLKIAQYGEFMMDKSQTSDKQMPSFRYNPAGVAKIGELLGTQQHAPPQQHTLILQ
ncbi:hypothetical protein [Massilia sp. S19_KUP03_FR1]|uniref:hypothetical protein n=1 Tax=Massilia sp. S19_KUP03_FR1 TaxID=3025503 RepID=UPI002FCCD07D